MRIVLGMDCFPDAVTEDSEGVLAVCDEVIISEEILRVYERATAFSNLRPFLDTHVQNYPHKFNLRPHLGPVEQIQGLRSQHNAIVRDAVRAEADFLVTEYAQWAKLERSLHEKHGLTVVAPHQYVARRRRSRT